MVRIAALWLVAWEGSARARDPWGDERREEDPEQLLLETELAIEELQDPEPTEDAIEMGILENELERVRPVVLPTELFTVARFVDEPVPGDPAPPFRDLLDHAVARAGVSSSTLARAVARARFFPRLTLLGRHERKTATAADGSGTEIRWLVELHLCFGACGTNLTIEDVDGDAAPDLMVTAGEVVELDDRGAYASAATRVLEGAAEHRLALGDRLADLYTTRALVRSERGATLLEEVRRSLDLAEIDARLDVYTDGWFTSAEVPR
jgi:hypothetical protein